MILSVKHQERYSRGELLLRTILGAFYIVLPHLFILFFVSIWGNILSFIAFWVILFTGRYPQSMFEFQEQLLRWNLRLNARIYNLADDYPSFGLSATDEHTTLEVPFPESISRGLVLVRAFFGVFYVVLPHGFILFFRFLWMNILLLLGWFSILFTAQLPKAWHTFAVETIRWQTRVTLYMGYMTDEYPPFSGKE